MKASAMLTAEVAHLIESFGDESLRARYMAALYGHDEATTLGELGELAYRDPATGEPIEDALLAEDHGAQWTI